MQLEIQIGASLGARRTYMEDLKKEALCSQFGVGGALITEGGVAHPCASGSSCRQGNNPQTSAGGTPPDPHPHWEQNGSRPGLPSTAYNWRRKQKPLCTADTRSVCGVYKERPAEPGRGSARPVTEQRARPVLPLSCFRTG